MSGHVDAPGRPYRPTGGELGRMGSLPAPPHGEFLAIRTPDQRLRVFVSSTLQELGEERAAARAAIERLRLTPVMFELGARPHPPRALYRAYLEQSQVFIGIYGERYGWVAQTMSISGLEDEYELAVHLPKLLYVRTPARERDPGLTALLDRIEREGTSSFRRFSAPIELGDLIENDLATLLSERFGASEPVAASPRRAAVPAPLTGLVGRRDELATLRELLRPIGPRLVTLTGPGGIGKTRLGLQAARDAVGAFQDGVYFVSLESIQDPGLIAQAITHALGLRDASGRFDADVLRDWLHDRECLLVLDNFEHVRSAADVVTTLSESCPRLHVLVTSRIPLRVRGETEILVEPLETPPPGKTIDRLTPGLSPAVELFVERARAGRGDFTLTEENAEAVAEICRRMDGLPLAIELAAVQVRMMSPNAVLTRLERRLDALGSTPRDLPERQRTLRDTIAWSYDLLPPDSQLHFEQLSVFVGGWTLEAAESVGADPDGTPSPLDRLSDLIDASLVRVARDGGTEPRFTMLETIREFGLERLGARGELEAVAERHASYFGALAVEADRSSHSPESSRWLIRLDQEIDNVRAALDWVEANGRIADTLTIASSLWAFWEGRGYVREAVQRLRRALDHSEGVPHGTVAKALVRAGWLTRDLGDHAEAEKLIEDGLRRWREIGDESGMALALSNLGAIVIRRRDHERANALLEESLALRRRIGDPVTISATLLNLAFVALDQGEPERAVALNAEALEVARTTGDDEHILRALLNLGDAYVYLGDLECAAAALEEAETVNARLGDRFMGAVLADEAGILSERSGDLVRARQKLSEAVMVFKEMGARQHAVECLEHIARLTEREGRAETTTRLLALAETERGTTGVSRSLTNVPEHDALLVQIRQQLGDEVFSAEWDVGVQLTLDEGIALSIGDQPDPKKTANLGSN